MDINANETTNSAAATSETLDGMEKDMDQACDVKFKSASGSSSQVTFKASLYGAFRANLWVFPLLIAILMPVMFASIYISAWNQIEMEPFLPYISDISVSPPRAAMFSQFLDIIAILILISAFIRYKQLKHRIQVQLASAVGSSFDLTRLKQANFGAYFTAGIASSAMIILGNVRTNESVHPHVVSAVVTGVALYVYSWIMFYVCLMLSRFGLESKPISMGVIASLGTIASIMTAICTIGSMVAARDMNPWDVQTRLQWSGNNEGHLWHLLATTSEWILALLWTPLYLCIGWRMKRFAEWELVKFSS